MDGWLPALSLRPGAGAAPLQDQYGERLDILLVELVDAESVNLLYQVAESIGIPKENVSVPFLVIGDKVLVGSEQIPAQLPGLIVMHLASGGVDYPNLPGMVDLIPISDSSEITWEALAL